MKPFLATMMLALALASCLGKPDIHFECRGGQAVINGSPHSCSASVVPNACLIALGCEPTSGGYRCPTNLPQSPVDGSFCSQESHGVNSCGEAVIDCGKTPDTGGGGGSGIAGRGMGGPASGASGAGGAASAGTGTGGATGSDLCRGGSVSACSSVQYFSDGTCHACTPEGVACTRADKACFDCCSHYSFEGTCIECTPTGTACRGPACADCCNSRAGVAGVCVECVKNADCSCPKSCVSNRCQ
jgi:hypothetical protein